MKIYPNVKIPKLKENLGVLFNDTLIQKLIFFHKLKFSNPYIFTTSNRIHSLKYQRSKKVGCKGMGSFRLRETDYS